MQKINRAQGADDGGDEDQTVNAAFARRQEAVPHPPVVQDEQDGKRQREEDQVGGNEGAAPRNGGVGIDVSMGPAEEPVGQDQRQEGGGHDVEDRHCVLPQLFVAQEAHVESEVRRREEK